MRVRPLLAGFVGAVAGVLKEAHGLAELSVGADLIRGDAAAAIVGDERHAAFGVERHMARPAALRRDLVQLPQRAAFSMLKALTEPVSARPRPHLVDRVNEAVAGWIAMNVGWASRGKLRGSKSCRSSS